MKTKIVLISAAVLFSGIAALQAADQTIQSASTASLTNMSNYNLSGTSTNEELYRSWEASIEAFAAGTISQRRDYSSAGGPYSIHHHRADIGGGLGAEFFFNKYIGIEGEGIALADEPNFVHSAGGNLVLRWPIGNTGLAPYIFGGAGHQWNFRDATYEDGGLGLEYRFTTWIGIFVDARFVTTDNDGNYGLGRLGVKFIF